MQLLDRSTFITRTMLLLRSSMNIDTSTIDTLTPMLTNKDHLHTPMSSVSSVVSFDDTIMTASIEELPSSPSKGCTEKTCVYHPPPSGVNYEDNMTIFGKILQGESPARIWYETDHVLAFEDIHPRARMHSLVIPKRLIRSVFDLTSNDLELLEEMRNSAIQLLREMQPIAYAKGDYILCFHVPPYNSVDHLHLHVLAPRSKMSFFPRFIKYNTITNLAASLDSVESRLRNGRKPVPYHRPKGF